MFINFRPYPKWNGNFTIIGKAICGIGVLDRLDSGPVVERKAPDGFIYHAPVTPGRIISIRVIDSKETGICLPAL